jgi:transcriptional regulator of heat shock response
LNIRLITDEEELKLIGSVVRDLGEEGIQIRTDTSGESLMHNKFVIIDQKILMTGSYNWTVASTEVNQENVVIMENDQLVETFMNEFNKLWKQFSPQDLDDQKAKTKTRLFIKYQEAQKKRDKKPLALMTQEDPEEVILDAGGINPISKKIGKIQMFKDLLCCKRMRKAKHSEDSDDEEAPQKKSEVHL